MLGFKSKNVAKSAYDDAYAANWQGFLAITAMTFEQFRRWLEHGDQTKPIHNQVTEKYCARRRRAASTRQRHAARRSVRPHGHTGEPLLQAARANYDGPAAVSRQHRRGAEMGAGELAG